MSFPEFVLRTRLKAKSLLLRASRSNCLALVLERELSRIHVTRGQKFAAYLVDKIGDILHRIRFLARNIFLSKTTRTRLSDSRTRTRVVKLT